MDKNTSMRQKSEIPYGEVCEGNPHPRSTGHDWQLLEKGEVVDGECFDVMQCKYCREKVERKLDYKVSRI